MLNRPDSFMWYSNVGVESLSTSDFLNGNMKIRLRLIRGRPSFYMISGNTDYSLAIDVCSLYIRCISLKDDYHMKIMGKLACIPVEFNCLETVAKTFIITARQNQFMQENIFDNAPVRRFVIAMNTNSAFTGS